MFIGIDEIDEGFAMFGDFDCHEDFYGDEDNDDRAFLFEDEDDRSYWSDEGANLSLNTFEPKKHVRAVAWNLGMLASLVNKEPVNIIFEPGINDYNGLRSVQCVVSSIEPAGDRSQFPDRKALGRIYKFLRSYAKNESVKPFDICKIADAFSRSTMALDDPKLNSIFTMASAVEVFGEIGLIRFDAERKKFFMPIPNKTFDLNRSRLFILNSEGGANER